MAGQCRHRQLTRMDFAHVHEVLGGSYSEWPEWFRKAWQCGSVGLGPGTGRVTIVGRGGAVIAEPDDILVHNNGTVTRYDQTTFDKMYEVLP